MGNDRTFTVAQNGSITWNWNGTRRFGEGSRFDQQYGSPERQGPEKRLDTHERYRPATERELPALDSELRRHRRGEPRDEPNRRCHRAAGNHSSLYEQHSPYRLSEWGTIIIADSENDRVVEYDLQSEEAVWTHGGDDVLLWPRDADRFPNGNTLIVDSLHTRVIEVNPSGEIVWEYSGVRLSYTADRKGVSEEGGETVPGWQLDGETQNAAAPVGFVRQVEGWASYVLPVWVQLPELLTLLGIAVTGILFTVDLACQHLPRCIARRSS